MRDFIISNKAGELEKLYRRDKTEFRRQFDNIYPEIKDYLLANFWQERLHYSSEKASRAGKAEWVFIIISTLLAGLLAKLPDIFSLDEELFYLRNSGFIIFPFLAGFFIWKNKFSITKTAILAIIVIASLLYINLLPNDKNSDTFILACLHLPFLLWALFGVSFVGNDPGYSEKRLDFLRFNGDLLVTMAFLVLSGVIFTGITLGLFELIGVQIVKFYFDYVVVFGLPAVPIAGMFLNYTNPQLVNRVSPVIARIFSPLVLAMLVVYLGTLILTGKNLYTDREFLLLFNILLIGVMALIFFSVAKISLKQYSAEKWVLFLLSLVTILVNSIALSAILFRISEWGITPNRLAVLGANMLILLQMFIVTFRLYQAIAKKPSAQLIGSSIVNYLPVYVAWAVIVVFLFPFIFNFT
ncbi:hypothetical protein [Zunongwangia sp. H14]|uniref:hypothetical protein n=1 Tax=Zunongwangia sp. H14 TaxID=3240792 RepID=UPI0035653D32